MEGPICRMLPDGRRLHLNHGPIDLVVESFGDARARRLSYERAAWRFESILGELVAEGAALRRPPEGVPRGSVARRMFAAVEPHADSCFVTPMAAVAGSVADEVLEAMTGGISLDRAYVNNGGDIAFHLGEGESFEIGLAVASPAPGLLGSVSVRPGDHVRGAATSGRFGRSLSLGIADSATALGRSAAEADAAATLIANAVDLPGHPGIWRAPASEVAPDSDLGARPVTTGVGPLSKADAADALAAGQSLAGNFRKRGLAAGAWLSLRGLVRTEGLEKIPGKRSRWGILSAGPVMGTRPAPRANQTGRPAAART